MKEKQTTEGLIYIVSNFERILHFNFRLHRSSMANMGYVVGCHVFSTFFWNTSVLTEKIASSFTSWKGHVLFRPNEPTSQCLHALLYLFEVWGKGDGIHVTPFNLLYAKKKISRDGNPHFERRTETKTKKRTSQSSQSSSSNLCILQPRFDCQDPHHPPFILNHLIFISPVSSFPI